MQFANANVFQFLLYLFKTRIWLNKGYIRTTARTSIKPKCCPDDVSEHHSVSNTSKATLGLAANNWAANSGSTCNAEGHCYQHLRSMCKLQRALLNTFERHAIERTTHSLIYSNRLPAAGHCCAAAPITTCRAAPPN